MFAYLAYDGQNLNDLKESISYDEVSVPIIEMVMDTLGMKSAAPTEDEGEEAASGVIKRPAGRPPACRLPQGRLGREKSTPHSARCTLHLALMQRFWCALSTECTEISEHLECTCTECSSFSSPLSTECTRALSALLLTSSP